MESVVFLLFTSSIISMFGGTNQEPSLQKVYLGLFLPDPTKKKPPTLALVSSETYLLFACASKIISFINAMKIPYHQYLNFIN
jgi:hypothetical protein